MNDLDTTQQGLVDLQLVLTNSSFGHEYARQAFDEAISLDKKEECLAKMEQFRQLYFQAREAIEEHFPELLDEIEQEIHSQKSAFFSDYNA